MSNPNPDQSGLNPIKKGERRAAKPDSQKRTKPLKIMLTPNEFEAFGKQAEEDGDKSMTSRARRLLGL